MHWALLPWRFISVLAIAERAETLAGKKADRQAVELSHFGAPSGCVNSNSNYFLFHFLLGQTLSRSQASAMRS